MFTFSQLNSKICTVFLINWYTVLISFNTQLNYFCNCSMFCCTLLYVHSSIAIILMGKRVLVALLYLSSWRLVMVDRLFLAVPRGCLRFVLVVFPDHTHYFWKLYNFIQFFCKHLSRQELASLACGPADL